ncbi:hypothetical protein X801_04311 [Opisthorchis viverrini]|uniref:Uncharacterized protein n=1 Tax=Opisthorchis viverrini TaxID=6198 RepID=A0A1S8WZF2_OPIVI|nr:hypothetical protein X801_04311 [Opisthorchis viverrini]
MESLEERHNLNSQLNQGPHATSANALAEPAAISTVVSRRSCVLDLSPWMDHHVLVQTASGFYQPGIILNVEKTTGELVVRLDHSDSNTILVEISSSSASEPKIIDDAIPHANQLIE